MASNLDFAVFVCGQMQEAGTVTYRKMFGEFGLYLDGKYFACICDNCLFVKVTKSGTKLLPDCPKASPYPGAAPIFLIENLEDSEFLSHLATVTCQDLPAPKARKAKAKKEVL